MEKEKLDLEALHTVTPEEFQQHFDVLTEEARTGNVPLRIRAEDGSSDLLLFAWDDFFAHFHEIYETMIAAAAAFLRGHLDRVYRS